MPSNLSLPIGPSATLAPNEESSGGLLRLLQSLREMSGGKVPQSLGGVVEEANLGSLAPVGMIPTVGNLARFEKAASEGARSTRPFLAKILGKTPTPLEEAVGWLTARHPRLMKKFTVTMKNVPESKLPTPLPGSGQKTGAYIQPYKGVEGKAKTKKFGDITFTRKGYGQKDMEDVLWALSHEVGHGLETGLYPASQTTRLQREGLADVVRNIVLKEYDRYANVIQERNALLGEASYPTSPFPAEAFQPSWKTAPNYSSLSLQQLKQIMGLIK